MCTMRPNADDTSDFETKQGRSGPLAAGTPCRFLICRPPPGAGAIGCEKRRDGISKHESQVVEIAGTGVPAIFNRPFGTGLSAGMAGWFGWFLKGVMMAELVVLTSIAGRSVVVTGNEQGNWKKGSPGLFAANGPGCRSSGASLPGQRR